MSALVSARMYDPMEWTEYLHMVQTKDLNFMGIVHGGVLMTLMDEAAGVACLRFAQRKMWTVLVSDLKFVGAVVPGDLLKAYSRVAFAAEQSCEVQLCVYAEKMRTLESRLVCTAWYTFASASDDRASALPSLDPRTPAQQALHACGRERYLLRKQQREDSLTPTPKLEDTVPSAKL